MAREFTVRLSAVVDTSQVPGLCLPTVAVPVRCARVGPYRAVGDARVARRGDSGTVDVRATLAPLLWLFEPEGLAKYSRVSFGAQPVIDGAYRLSEIWLCEPNVGRGHWPYTVGTEWS